MRRIGLQEQYLEAHPPLPMMKDSPTSDWPARPARPTICRYCARDTGPPPCQRPRKMTRRAGRLMPAQPKPELGEKQDHVTN